MARAAREGCCAGVMVPRFIEEISEDGRFVEFLEHFGATSASVKSGKDRPAE